MIMTSILSSLVCLIATIGSIRSAGDVCETLPPGLQQMTRGIDITRLDLFPEDLAQSNGFQRSLIPLTCTKGRKWKHPFDANLVLDVPDQVATINTLPGGVMNTKTSLIETSDDFKKSMSVDVGLTADTVMYGAYSASGSYKKAQENLVNTTKSIVQVSAYVSAVRVDFNPYYELKADNYFQEFVEKLLPDKYEENPEKYQEFVETFGTHYFDSAFFGGFLQQTIEMSQNLNLKLSENDIQVNAEASFLQVIKLKGGYNGENKNVSQEFSKDTHVYTSYYGGKSNLMKDNGWADWWESVPHDPWLFGGNLKPIENLVSGAKNAQVKEAVRIKLDKAYLEDLKQSLTLFSRYFSVPAQTQLAAIDKVLAETIPSHSEVIAVKQSVDDFLAKENAKLDKTYLAGLEASLTDLENSELFCKHLVADKCMEDHLKDVDQTIATAKQLFQSAEQLKSVDIPDRMHFKELSRTVQQFIYNVKTQEIGECQEKLFCNLCKITEAIIAHGKQCDTVEIKKLLNIHV